MYKVILPLVLSLFSHSVFAEYNDNMSGKVASVLTYTDSDYIYFTLDNQPTSHSACNPAFFVIEETIPYERRQILLSRLLTAYAKQESLNIGFDNAGNCAHGYIRVHRIG